MYSWIIQTQIAILFGSYLIYSRIHTRVSDPYDFGGNDVISFDNSAGSSYTIDNDIPGEPLGPADFNRKISQTQISLNFSGRMDPIELAGLYEGDIVLSATDNIGTFSMYVRHELRNAVNDEIRLWSNGIIPYAISKSYGLDDRAIVAQAIKEFHSQTCILFIPRTSQKDYIHILKGDGCSSSVGRVGGSQQVSLGKGCLIVGVVMHELMHATGFWHEQSRADRDDYIKIVWANIQPGMEFNFKKYNWSEIQNLSVPYDATSIMHYGPYAFARDRQKPTIIPHQTEPIGQRDGFSNLDLEKISKLYKCNEPKLPTNAIVVSLISKPAECKDFNKNCNAWAQINECETNSIWMNSNCKKACKKCGEPCGDSHVHCKTWMNANECVTSAPFMMQVCQLSCGLCNHNKDSPPGPVCKDENKYCRSWAENALCLISPSYMKAHCKKSCNFC